MRMEEEHVLCISSIVAPNWIRRWQMANSTHNWVVFMSFYRYSTVCTVCTCLVLMFWTANIRWDSIWVNFSKAKHAQASSWVISSLLIPLIQLTTSSCPTPIWYHQHGGGKSDIETVEHTPINTYSNSLMLVSWLNHMIYWINKSVSNVHVRLKDVIH